MGTSTLQERLGLISAIRDAGLLACNGCWSCPHFTESIERLDWLLGQIVATGVKVFVLHLRGSIRG